MNKIINHWCIFYVWLFMYFEKKKFKGAKNMADEIVIVPLLLYPTLYFILPIVVMLSESRNVFREYKLTFIFSISILAVFIIGLLMKNKYLKERIETLKNTSDWYDSNFYNKGRNIVRFHLIFSFVSLPISAIIGYIIYNW